MKSNTRMSGSVRNLVELSVMSALVIILQLLATVTAGAIPVLETSVNLVLIPITIGAIVKGPKAGAILGCVCGVTVLLFGIFGLDKFTNILFDANPIMTSLICIVKSTAAGLLAGIVYRALRNMNGWVALFAAAAIVPIVNTALFIVGGFAIADTLKEQFSVSGSDLVYFLFITCAGINFLVEFTVNLILSPTVYRILPFLTKQNEKNN